MGQLKKNDVFGYFILKDEWHSGCPKCKQESCVNVNFNNKIVCINPKCDFEWNRYASKKKQNK